MRDRTAFLCLAAATVVTIGVVSFLRLRTATAARPALAPVPVAIRAPALPSASAPPLQRLVIHGAVHPPAPRGSGKTPERLAADAVHAGDHRRAAALYAELAARYPENPAFAAAAETLQRAAR